ncbi:calcium-activated chloride channel-domain-containing protein, partial [Jimgerdemannia flammicorona]
MADSGGRLPQDPEPLRREGALTNSNIPTQIGFYFAFLQFYFLSLTPPSVLGFLVYLFGLNSYSITFSSLMVIWSIFFTSLWERRERELAVQWGTHHQSKTERRRAAFKGELVIDDPITGSKVSYVPVWKTWARRAASVPGIIVGAVGLSLVVSAVFTIEVFLKEYYRGPLHEIL